MKYINDNLSNRIVFKIEKLIKDNCKINDTFFYSSIDYSLVVNLCFVPPCQLCILYIFVLLKFVKWSNFSPTFRLNQQEDAHEFLQCFLNKLEICCYNLEPRDNIVKEAFGGRLVSMVSITCLFSVFYLDFFTPVVCVFWTAL